MYSGFRKSAFLRMTGFGICNSRTSRMKYLLFIFALATSFPLSMKAQENDSIPAEPAYTIFDNLEKTKAGEGIVTIHQSEAIRKLVGACKFGKDVETTDDETFLKIQGFRTQVFSGNNQRESKDEAFSKEKEIKELFPDLPTYVTYTAPFWKLRVGDFRSHEEAYHVLRQLMAAFPSYAKEMYIIREEVKIPLN